MINILLNCYHILPYTFLENNIKIYGIREEEISLEEAFLKRTGGNVIE